MKMSRKPIAKKKPAAMGTIGFTAGKEAQPSQKSETTILNRLGQKRDNTTIEIQPRTRGHQDRRVAVGGIPQPLPRFVLLPTLCCGRSCSTGR